MFGSKQLSEYAIWTKRGLRDDSFRSAKGRATSTDIQIVGGHKRGQPCTAEATIACTCRFALCWLDCEGVNCGAWQCWGLRCLSARFLSSSDGRSVGLHICGWVFTGEVVNRPSGRCCFPAFPMELGPLGQRRNVAGKCLP